MIGPVSPSSKHVFIGTGFQGWGMTNGTLAAIIISDLILGKNNPWEKLYSPNRINFKESAGRFAKETLNVGKEFIGSKLPITKEADLSSVKKGKGKIIEVKGKILGIYRDYQGKLFAVSAFCTFEGCRLSWNNAEKTWDCPCCGSRFNYDGTLILNPAVQDLEKINL